MILTCLAVLSYFTTQYAGLQLQSHPDTPFVPGRHPIRPFTLLDSNMPKSQPLFAARKSLHALGLPAILVAFGLCSAGCNSEPSATPNPTRSNTHSIAAGSVAPRAGESADLADVPSPTDVVSQFLDRVRRGGETTDAGQLLTQRAQSELKRIGRTVQPIGTPDARFDVRQAAAIPNEPGSMLVQSIWTEPNNDGSNGQYEVVWAVHREPVGWRISGLAMEMNPGQPPIVIDFENGDEMAKLLAGSEQDDSANTQQANRGSAIEAKR